MDKKMKEPEIIIKTDGIMNAEIYVDGKKVDGVTGFRFAQSYKENSGLPILQIDLMATNVTLDAKMLPALPEPFAGKYISINSLLNSKEIPREMILDFFREQGIYLYIGNEVND